MLEGLILAVIIAATLGVLWLAKRHGIVLRPDAGGLEALPKELADKNEQH